MFWAQYQQINPHLGFVELTDTRTNTWAGSFRVESSYAPLTLDDYCRKAESEAALKGGRLERLSPLEDAPAAPRAAEPCSHCIRPERSRRPVNGLNVEVGAPTPRCMLKSPDGRGAIWLWSGGSPLVYGVCTPRNCPEG